MKYLLAACAALLALSLVFCASGAEDLRNGFIRLHILAQSDREEDQAEKLMLRDALLSRFGAELATNSEKEQARQMLSGMLEEIQRFADGVLAESGSENRCTVTLGTEYYPQRSYGDVTLPAGSYTSLRVIIGEGSGKNWWCVLFPPVCLNAASDKSGEEKVYLSAGFTPEEYRVISNNRTGKYKLKFKLFELFGRLFA